MPQFHHRECSSGDYRATKITTALWGSRSHYVNDANLTQILYLIRRDLKALGINDLFITIPRQGLKVNSDIAIIATDSETKGRKNRLYGKPSPP